jgi:hypothetical protein
MEIHNLSRCSHDFPMKTSKPPFPHGILLMDFTASGVQSLSSWIPHALMAFPQGWSFEVCGKVCGRPKCLLRRLQGDNSFFATLRKIYLRFKGCAVFPREKHPRKIWSNMRIRLSVMGFYLTIKQWDLTNLGACLKMEYCILQIFGHQIIGKIRWTNW